jgi:hypothetical protein
LKKILLNKDQNTITLATLPGPFGCFKKTVLV